MSYPPEPPSNPTRPMPAPAWSTPTPKKSYTRVIIASIIGAVLVCGCLATAGFILAGRFVNTISDARQPEAPRGGQPEVQIYELGEAATIEQEGGRLSVTVTRAEWFDELCTSRGQLPNGRTVVLDVTLEALAGTVRYITPSDFKFVTEDGELHSVASNASGCVKTSVLLYVGVSAGQTLNGQIDFDVSTGGEVRYLVPSPDGSTAAWRIPAA